MKPIYIGFENEHGCNNYSAVLIVEADGKLYQGRIKAIDYGVLGVEYRYKPMNFYGLPEQFAKDLIFKHKPVFNAHIERSEVGVIQLTPEQIEVITENLNVNELEEVVEPICFERVLYTPLESVQIVERFETRSGSAKFSLLSVNAETGEKTYLKTVNPYGGV
ncbi:MAG: hypothetical protein CMF61_04755 [Magnetococcales bacterium]|nr:hypothetical protein [Magnetococcales bacterium]|tara:strand:+ start:136 stop:624 length:489 start_codon:yes stop_codon:yes gene_type:complete